MICDVHHMYLHDRCIAAQNGFGDNLVVGEMIFWYGLNAAADASIACSVQSAKHKCTRIHTHNACIHTHACTHARTSHACTHTHTHAACDFYITATSVAMMHRGRLELPNERRAKILTSNEKMCNTTLRWPSAITCQSVMTNIRSLRFNQLIGFVVYPSTGSMVLTGR